MDFTCFMLILRKREKNNAFILRKREKGDIFISRKRDYEYKMISMW